MRSLACFAVVVIAACSTKQPKQEPSTTTKSARDPWATPSGSAGSSGSAEPVPKWASDPPNVLRDKVNGVNAHVIVLKSQTTFAEYRDVLTVVEGTPGVIAAEPFIFSELEISSKTSKTPVSFALKGVDPARVGRVLMVGRNIKSGTMDSLGKNEPPRIVIGDVLARTLGVDVGGDVTITAPKQSPDAYDLDVLAKMKPTVFRVGGTFHMDFDEYDERLAFAPLSAVQAMLGRGDQVMGIEMTVKDLDKSGELAKAIEDKLGGPPYQVMDWYELNKQLFTRLYGDHRP